MKQIKKIVLRDATKLTNSEMKSIRGGANGEPPGSYSAVCSASCYHSTGAYLRDVSAICIGTQEHYCDIVSGAGGILGVGCFNKSNDGNIIDIPGTFSSCLEGYPE